MDEFISPVDGHRHFGGRAEWCAVCSLEAERDQLRDRLDAYEGDVEEWEAMRQTISESSLGTPGAAALAARTPPGTARAIVLGAEYLRRAEEAEAERDRLRAVVEADRRVLALFGEYPVMDNPQVSEAWEAYREAHRQLDGYEVPDE